MILNTGNLGDKLLKGNWGDLGLSGKLFTANRLQALGHRFLGEPHCTAVMCLCCVKLVTPVHLPELQVPHF